MNPAAEREGFEPPGREPFRFQGGCIWPLCHRSVPQVSARSSPAEGCLGLAAATAKSGTDRLEDFAPVALVVNVPTCANASSRNALIVPAG